MSRLNNVDSLHAHHFAWKGDCFSSTFSFTKTDPTGASTSDPKHCFSNPLAPEIDTLLALAMYFSTFKEVDEFDPKAPVPTEDTAGAAEADDADKVETPYRSPPIFPGKDQQKRFVKVLGELLDQKGVEETMKRMGVSVTDIAGHSTRKGSATYVASGSTFTASYAALCRRCGWKMGVQERYIFLLAAADCLIGRTVSGLPTGVADFGMLPPHFPVDADLDSATRAQFGPWADVDGIRELLPFLLAALVHHHDWVLDNCQLEGPARHPVFDTPVFADGSIRAQLTDILVAPALESAHMTASGIPPHTRIMQQLLRLENLTVQFRESQKDFREMIVKLPQQVAEAVRDTFDDRQSEMGQVSLPVLKNILEVSASSFVRTYVCTHIPSC